MLANQSIDSVQEPKFYLGLARVELLAVNPTPEEMVTIGYIAREKIEETRNRLKPHRQSDGRYRLDFYVRMAEEGVSQSKILKHTIFVENTDKAPAKNTGSIRVIDCCQKTGWISLSDFQAGKNQQVNGSVWLQAPYRRAKEGEDELYMLLRAITGAEKHQSIPEPDIAQICQGNESSIEKVIAGNSAKKNTFFTVLLGLQISEEGTIYQVIWKDIRPQWHSEKDKVLQKLRNDVRYYEQTSQKEFVYGFSASFTHSDFACRAITKSQIQLLRQRGTPAAATVGGVAFMAGMPPPALGAILPEIDTLLASTPIGLLTQAKSLPDQAVTDEDLPF